MFGYKKLMEKLSVVERKLERMTNLVNADQRMAEQNERLLDRLMSRNWEAYATYRPDDSKPDKGDTGDILTPTNDEASIGEILSDEELGI